MAFYELITIIRQDVASAEVDKIVVEFTKIIESYKGKVVKTEYWGLRTLAYEIKNNKKGHYYFLGIEATQELLTELDRKIKLNDAVIRSSLVRVDEISESASPILKTEHSTNTTQTIDVTV